MGCFLSLLGSGAHAAPENINGIRKRQSTSSNRKRNERRLRPLVSAAVMDPRQRAVISALEGDDAQQMVDFLDLTLRETSTHTSDVWKHELSLFGELAKSANIYPRCYMLSDVRRDAGPVSGGSLADIYKGQHKGETICLKMLRVFGQRDHDQILRGHVKELVLWAQLAHPNVLPFYGVYLLDRRICLVSPWMEHGSLPDYLDEHPETSRIPLLLDVVHGLEYLHQSDIVHGDLKASNVLVSDRGRAVITDFGLSSIINSTPLISMTQLSRGTLRWRAPELLAGDSNTMHPTPQSDIWSFGCLCYEVLAKKIPFYQYGEVQVVSILLMGKGVPTGPSPGDGGEVIDSEMWSIMTRCWNHAPQRRPTCDQIRSLIAGLQVHDDRPQAPITPSKISDFWKEMNKGSGFQVDYERVEGILRRVNHAS